MFRRFLAVTANLPGLIFVLVGPVIGLLQGHLKYPDVLLSDLMAVPSYKEVIGCQTITCLAVAIYLWLEVLRYTRKRAPAEVHRSLDVMVVLLVFVIFPGDLLVVFFPFEEIGLYWFLHCLGAAMVFAAMAGMGFTYIKFVAPVLNKFEIVPKQDAFCRRMSCSLVCLFMVIAACVRPFHMADPARWGWLMLAIEIVFSLIGLLATVLGNWQTLGEMDRTDSVAFEAVPAGKSSKRD